MLGARDHLSAGAGQLYYYDEQKTQVQKAVANVRKITIRRSRGPTTPAAKDWAKARTPTSRAAFCGAASSREIGEASPKARFSGACLERLYVHLSKREKTFVFSVNFLGNSKATISFAASLSP